MRNKWAIPAIVSFTLIGLLLAAAVSGGQLQQMLIPTPTPTPTVPTPTLTPTPTPRATVIPTTPTPRAISTPTPTPVRQVNITISSPQPNQIVTSPLRITGQAQGQWFFEATAPVRLVDSNNQTIAQGFITAQGDWMTTNFVPFSEELTFATPSTSTGQLILERSNPSGLPQNNQQVTVPVRFR